MFLWRQGERHPVEDLMDPDYRINPSRFVEFTLPAEFDLIGTCQNGDTVRARGRCEDGVWLVTDTSEAERQAADDAERLRIRRLRESWR
jgi:hypothetical protein